MLTYDYITDFHDVAEITIPGTVHTLIHGPIEVCVKVRHLDGHWIPYFLAWWHRIDPETCTVTVSLMTNRHSGVVILSTPSMGSNAAV